MNPAHRVLIRFVVHPELYGIKSGYKLYKILKRAGLWYRDQVSPLSPPHQTLNRLSGAFLSPRNTASLYSPHGKYDPIFRL